MLDLKELDSVKMSQLGELLQESFAGLCNVVTGSHCDDQIPKNIVIYVRNRCHVHINVIFSSHILAVCKTIHFDHIS